MLTQRVEWAKEEREIFGYKAQLFAFFAGQSPAEDLRRRG